jgi:pilus assembly protein CpaE
MPRKAMIVAGSAGPQEMVDEVLRRFGFAAPEAAPTVSAAAATLRTGQYEIVIIPLQSVDAVELVTLDREARAVGAHVIGTAPRADADLILRAMRSGVHEFVLFPPDPKELASALDRLLRRNAPEQARGAVTALYSAKGGLGTTSLAINLAYAIAKLAPDGRVALADLVVSGGDIRVLLDLRDVYDVGDLVARMTRIDADMLTSLLTPRGEGVWVLPASERPEMFELVDASATSTVIAHLRAHFQHSLLDCEHYLSERTLTALDAADQVLLITQLNVAALRSAQRSLNIFEQLGYETGKVQVVINRYNSNDVIGLEDAVKLLGRPVEHTLPNDTRVSNAAVAQSSSVVAHDSNSALARSYMALAAKLTGGAAAALPAKVGDARGSSRIGRLLGLGKKS